MQARWMKGAALAVVFVLVGASIALADNLAASGDDVTAGGGTLNLGTICADEESSSTVSVAARRNGNYPSTNVWQDGATVTFTVLSTTGTGLTASMDDDPSQVTLSGWEDTPNNALSDSKTATVSLDTSTTGSFSGSVKFQGSGSGSNGGDHTVTRELTLSVIAEVEECTPVDEADPTNASISIDDGAAWTNDAGGSVTVDISADDNVGVASYKLADTQAGLAGATAVAVSPAEASFSRTDLAFTLTGAEGAAKAVWLEVCDAAANCAQTSDTIGWDKTAPSIALSRTAGAANADTGTDGNGDGWTKNDPVSVDVTASDNLSLASISCTDSLDGGAAAPIAISPALTAGDTSYSGTLTVTGEGVHDLSCGASDPAGNSGGPAGHTVRIDTTGPAITITTPPDDAVYLLNADVYADFSCDDGSGSGVATCVGDEDDGDPIDTSTVGAYTFGVQATDVAGNSNSLTHDYSVNYGFVGFDRPVDNGYVFNIVKAGQGVPLKFRVVDADGVGIAGLTAPPVTVTVATKSCDLDATSDLLEEAAAGQSGLQDLGDGYYNFVWKTPKDYANSCKKLRLNLGDGNTSHTALFKFTR